MPEFHQKKRFEYITLCEPPLKRHIKTSDENAGAATQGGDGGATRGNSKVGGG